MTYQTLFPEIEPRLQEAGRAQQPLHHHQGNYQVACSEINAAVAQALQAAFAFHQGVTNALVKFL